MRLRRRIFKATREEDWAVVRSLQKLMLRFWSNTLVSARQVTQRNAGRRTAGAMGNQHWCEVPAAGAGTVAAHPLSLIDGPVRCHVLPGQWRPASPQTVRRTPVNVRRRPTQPNSKIAGQSPERGSAAGQDQTADVPLQRVVVSLPCVRCFVKVAGRKGSAARGADPFVATVLDGCWIL
ncbi:reverse transcriptase N-terminal domain-containing protein [Streptomyces brevispora]|uniref:reverse transcriptase N-terminal domain-containing protein n=1 Tax=Streptomyces brevispora TaxID=887462 RepID=UPI00371E685D